MDIHVFTPDFEFLHTILNPVSIRWNLKYNDVGTLEIYVDNKNEVIPFFIEHDDLILVQGDRSAWCSGVANDNGFLICGKTLNQMLKWRMVNPFSLNDTVENIIRTKVAEQFIIAGNKQVAGFILDEVIGDTQTIEYEFTDRQKSLFEVVQELCNKESLGFRVDFDFEEEKYIFELFRGMDLSSEQTNYPPLILSEVNRNISETQYFKNIENHSNCGYIKQVENDIVSWVEISQGEQGFYRREIDLTSQTVGEGETELKKYKKVVEVEGKVIDLIYNEDYTLGDIVTVQKLVGEALIVQNQRINEVIITYEGLDVSILPVLGVI